MANSKLFWMQQSEQYIILTAIYYFYIPPAMPGG